MMHASAHLLIEFADGELQESARDQLRRHLRDCTSCNAALFELKATRTSLASLLTELDDAEPDVWTSRVQTIYAEAPRPIARPTFDRVWRWAAGIVLLSGAAAAGAAILRDRAAPMPAVEAGPAPGPATSDLARPGSGVYVFAQDGAAVIELIGVVRATRIVISVSDDDMIGLHSYGKYTPTFTAQTGRIVVRMTQPAELRLLVPASLAGLRISANGMTVGVVEAGRWHLKSNEPAVRIELEER